MNDDLVVLRMKDVRKVFGSTVALDNVNFELLKGEIHGLLGGNGAGKTTLMNVLFGLYRADSGEIMLRGEKINIQSPRDAIQAGIGMVHQHFLQVNNFSVIQNIVLGSNVNHKFTMNLVDERQKIEELAERFGLNVDLDATIEFLPMGMRQKVEILKALYRGIDVLILDEPTTNLTPQEVDDLFHSLQEMVKRGMSIVFITHKLREVLSVCERISVLREGKNVLTLQRSQATEEAFVKAMVGDELDVESSIIFAEEGVAEATRAVGEQPVVQVQDLGLVSKDNLTLLKNINLTIHEGEILGLAGIAGNGQRELAEALLGVSPATSGHIFIDGKDMVGLSSREMLEAGVAYIPEDRLSDGFLRKASVAQNLILGHHRRPPYAKGGFIDWNSVTRISETLITEYNIKTQGPNDPGGNLSGGNIQRVMIARAFSQPSRLMVAHNPTRGLDIPSMDFVYTKMLARKVQGQATLLISENLDELLLLCDRMAVIFRGEIVGILDRNQFEKYEIGRMMSGVRTDD